MPPAADHGADRLTPAFVTAWSGSPEQKAMNYRHVRKLSEKWMVLRGEGDREVSRWAGKGVGFTERRKEIGKAGIVIDQ